MQKIPLVSIYIPSYNSILTLKKTLDSLRNVTRDDIEIVIVDNKSTDGSYDLILECIKLDRRIKLSQNKNFVPMGVNWNNALKKCSGKYIKLLCADDLINENILNEHIEILENHPSVAITTSDSFIIDESENILFFRKNPLTHNQLIRKNKVVQLCIKYATNIIGEPSILLMRSSAVYKAGEYNISYQYAIDLEFTLRVLDHGDLWVNALGVDTYRIHMGSITQKVVGLAEIELYNIFKEHSDNPVNKYKFLFTVRYRHYMKKLFLFLCNNRFLRYILLICRRLTHYFYR